MNTIKALVLTLLLLAPALADSKTDVATLLDNFHQAASQADGERYFGYFAPNGVFLGTDINERWNVEQFKAYAMPYFSKGKGWTYRPVSRKIYISEDGNTAWFDEILDNDNFGKTRGSGVLVKAGEQWKVAQYHLTLPVPNSLIEKVVKMIEADKS